MEPDLKPDFEREKWEADIRLREREIAVKEAEAKVAAEHLARSRWTNPMLLAISAAAIAAAGNAWVAYYNGIAQRAADERRAVAEDRLQAEKSSGDRQIEEGRAEAARILEVLKTNDADKAATNLAFLLETGLIIDAGRRQSLAAYLKTRPAGQGPALPAASTASAAPSWSLGYFCPLKDPQNPEAREAQLDRVRRDIRDDLNAGVPGIHVSLQDAAVHVDFDYLNGKPPGNRLLSDVDVEYAHVNDLVESKIFVGKLLPLGHVRGQVNSSIRSTLSRIFVDRPCVEAPS